MEGGGGGGCGKDTLKDHFEQDLWQTSSLPHCHISRISLIFRILCGNCSFAVLVSQVLRIPGPRKYCKLMCCIRLAFYMRSASPFQTQWDHLFRSKGPRVQPHSQTHSNALSETKLICINTFHK